MPKYETMLVTSATLDEDATLALVGKFKTLIENNGEIELVDEWGKRRLAYPINKQPDGIYTLIKFTSGPDFPAELDRVYNITDGVLRSLIIARPEDDVVEPPKAAEPVKAAPAEETPAAPAEEAAPAPAEQPAPAPAEAPAAEAAQETKEEEAAPAEETQEAE